MPDPRTLETYVAWLTEGGHVQAVLDGGAAHATVTRLHPGPDGALKVESRYLFASHSDFDRYEREHAPALRADGVARFGNTPGVSFSRWTGDLVQAWP
ncbi:MAG: DUF4286 family protein [Phycisphaerales bacterium]|nr:DUF4286 family protein [Phycisphaerales bacterium]